jgi:hypothetical protein
MFVSATGKPAATTSKPAGGAGSFGIDDVGDPFAKKK